MTSGRGHRYRDRAAGDARPRRAAQPLAAALRQPPSTALAGVAAAASGLASAGRVLRWPRPGDRAPAAPPRPGAGRGARARRRRAAAPGMAGKDGRGRGRRGRVPLRGRLLPEPLGRSHGDRRTRWNGPRFFGLRRPRAMTQRPGAARSTPARARRRGCSRTSTASTLSAQPAPPTSGARRARGGARSTSTTTTAASRADRWSGRR